VTRILVADDNRQLLDMLRAMLEDAGYEVVSASSGLAASALMDKEDVDLLILDVLMPGMSGDAVADLLRRSRPDLPVLLMTGDSGDQFVPGMEYPVLHKPFSEQQLVDAVQQLLPRA
jgi:CheY-like chemotaxis protein